MMKDLKVDKSEDEAPKYYEVVEASA